MHDMLAAKDRLQVEEVQSAQKCGQDARGLTVEKAEDLLVRPDHVVLQRLVDGSSVAAVDERLIEVGRIPCPSAVDGALMSGAAIKSSRKPPSAAGTSSLGYGRCRSRVFPPMRREPPVVSAHEKSTLADTPVCTISNPFDPILERVTPNDATACGSTTQTAHSRRDAATSAFNASTRTHSAGRARRRPDRPGSPPGLETGQRLFRRAGKARVRRAYRTT